MPTVVKAANAHTVVLNNGWTNPANAYATSGDNSYATATPPSKNSSATGDFGFPAFTTSDIPDGSIILAVRVVTEVGLTAVVTGGVYEMQLRRNSDGALLSSMMNKTTTTEEQLTCTATTLPTLAQLRLANEVRCRASVGKGNTNSGVTANLDFVRIEVDYAPLPGDAYGNEVVTDRPKTFHRFDEASGDFADYMGGAAATIAAATVTRVAGLVGAGAIQTDGVSGYATIPDSPAHSIITTGALTVVVVHKPIGNTNTTLLSKAGGSGYEWAIGWQDGIYNASVWTLGGTPVAFASVGTFAADARHHVAIVFDYTNQRIHIDVDGARITDTDAWAAAPENGTGLVNIGRRGDGVGYHPGVIDELAFYDYALTNTRTAAQHAALPAEGTPKVGADTAASSDASVVAATHLRTETGAGTDASIAAASLVPSDTAVGTDSAAIIVATSDTGAGTDAAVVAGAQVSADTGAGTDASVTTASAIVAETGAGADALSARDAALEDVGAGTEQAAQTIAFTTTDSAPSADASSVVAAVAALETALSDDAVAVAASVSVVEATTPTDASAQAATVSPSDVGTATDAGSAVEVPPDTVVVTDLAAGSDAATALTADLTPVESVLSTDAAVLAVAATSADSASSSDSAQVAIGVVEKVASDSASATDATALTSAHALSDLGAIEAEGATIDALYAVSQPAAGSDLAALTASVVASDVGAGTDASVALEVAENQIGEGDVTIITVMEGSALHTRVAAGTVSHANVGSGEGTVT